MNLAQMLLDDLECSDSELSILFTTDKHIQELNCQYRNKNIPTDVLSFAAREQAVKALPIDILGDVVISVETASRQAIERSISFKEEVLRLLIHGLLHLLGYDHENVEESEVKRMQEKEDFLMESCFSK